MADISRSCLLFFECEDERQRTSDAQLTAATCHLPLATPRFGSGRGRASGRRTDGWHMFLGGCDARRKETAG
jgi:hypothetical protein